MDFSLVLFTAFSQLAVGLTWVMACASIRPDWDSGKYYGRLHAGWLFAALMLLIALIASFFHLGQPLEAWRALDHVSESWLSREIWTFGILLGILTILCFVQYRWLAIVAGLVAAWGIICSGMTYATPAYPTYFNAFPLFIFGISAIILGSCFGVFVTTRVADDHLAIAQLVSASCGLCLILVVPCVWASGSLAMRLTAEAWLQSGVYWFGLFLTYVLPLIVLFVSWRNGGRPRDLSARMWLALLVLAGVLISRFQFLNYAASTTQLLGQ